MLLAFRCAHCDNTDTSKTREYNGLLGYEAVYYLVCGWFVDHQFPGWHSPDETSHHAGRSPERGACPTEDEMAAEIALAKKRGA